MSLSKRLSQLMKERTITMYALSKGIDVHQTSIKNWVDGTSTPNSIALQKIADYFNVSVDYLLERTDNPSLTNEVDASELEDVYLSFAKDAQANNIDPDDIRTAIQMFKQLKKKK